MKNGWEMKTLFGFLSANGAVLFSPKGATPSQPGATPQVWDVMMYRGPTARPNRRTMVQTGFQPSIFSPAGDLGRCPRLAWDRALPRKKGGQR